MSEHNLYKAFKKNWEAYIKRIENKEAYIKRIENNIDYGMPDIWLRNPARKKDIFVELKFLDNKFKKKKLHFRNTQRNWFSEYDGNAFVLFQVDNDYYIFDNTIFSAMDIDFSISFEDFEKTALFKFSDIKEACDYFYNY